MNYIFLESVMNYIFLESEVIYAENVINVILQYTDIFFSSKLDIINYN